MQNIKNIILDYGNVIFMIDFKRAQDAFTQLGVENVASIFGHLNQSDLFDNFDKGIITSAEFRDGVRDFVSNTALTDAQIDEAWNALLIGAPEGKYDVVQQLNERYRSFLLSNNNAIHYDYCMKHIQERYGYESNAPFFEQTYYSHLMGMRKPDPEIFEAVLREQGLQAGETLFIDDSPQHLATASALGIQTVLCTAENPLEKIVKELELI